MAEIEGDTKLFDGLSRQGWIGVAFWMSFGLLIEGLIGFRSPSYLSDPVRRELFRLAHTHGTVLSILLLIVFVYLAKNFIARPVAAIWSLRIGTVLMPVGFLLGGIWHYESDPGVMIFIAPVGGLMVIFGVIAIAVSTFRK
ncbi:MAG: hypothetical protein ABI878_04280 [Acidobacteriota bacterium]